MKKLLSILPVLFVLFGAKAFATDFFVSVQGGRASTDFNAEFTPAGISESGKSTLFSASAGLKFQSQIVTGVVFSGDFSDDFLGSSNHYHVYQGQVYVGYRFNLAKHFRITPQVGFAHWELKAEKSPIFGDDEDDITNKFKGNDIYSQINLEFPVGKLVTIVGSYSRTNYDFGRTNSVQAGVIFEFD